MIFVFNFEIFNKFSLFFFKKFSSFSFQKIVYFFFQEDIENSIFSNFFDFFFNFQGYAILQLRPKVGKSSSDSISGSGWFEISWISSSISSCRRCGSRGSGRDNPTSIRKSFLSIVPWRSAMWIFKSSSTLKTEFWSKINFTISIFSKFRSKNGISVKNRPFGQKCKYRPKSQNFGGKSKY